MDNPTYTHTTSRVEPAECPADGGKWAMYCTHYKNGIAIGTAIVQDTNKKRLATWRNHSVGWCCFCQNLRDYGTLEEHN